MRSAMGLAAAIPEAPQRGRGMIAFHGEGYAARDKDFVALCRSYGGGAFAGGVFPEGAGEPDDRRPELPGACAGDGFAMAAGLLCVPLGALRTALQLLFFAAGGTADDRRSARLGSAGGLFVQQRTGQPPGGKGASARGGVGSTTA